MSTNQPLNDQGIALLRRYAATFMNASKATADDRKAMYADVIQLMQVYATAHPEQAAEAMAVIDLAVAAGKELNTRDTQQNAPAAAAVGEVKTKAATDETSDWTPVMAPNDSATPVTPATSLLEEGVLVQRQQREAMLQQLREQLQTALREKKKKCVPIELQVSLDDITRPNWYRVIGGFENWIRLQNRPSAHFCLKRNMYAGDQNTNERVNWWVTAEPHAVDECPRCGGTTVRFD